MRTAGQFFKRRFMDIVFAVMILVSVFGLTYELLR